MREIKYCSIEKQFRELNTPEYRDIKLDGFSLKIAEIFLAIFQKISGFKYPIN